MDLSEARVEPFARFCELNDSFNKEFQVSVASLFHVSEIVSGRDGNQIMRRLIRATQEPWSMEFNWQDPSQLIAEATYNMVLLGIVQVHSVIDEFACNVEADYTRWRDFCSQRAGENKRPDDGIQSEYSVETDDERLEKMCVRLGWPNNEFTKWRPVLHYFRALRNCIVHRSGLSNKKLAEASRSADLTKVIGHLSQRDGATPPPLPTFEFNQEIILQPRYAIMAIIAARNACAYINRCFVNHLGEKGVVYLATYYTLLMDQPRINTAAYKSAAAVINHALSSRYRVELQNREEIIGVLQELNLWKECLKRHKQVYGDPPAPL